jgi:hypothetical protein
MFTQEIVTTITIDALPRRVWSVLTDFATYPAWNGFIRTAEGTARRGERLRLCMAPRDGRRLFRIAPRVLVAEEARELRWAGRILLPWLFDAEHRFVLAPEGRGTRLEQAERFRGLLVPVTGGMLRDTRAAFERMNLALKTRCEV